MPPGPDEPQTCRPAVVRTHPYSPEPAEEGVLQTVITERRAHVRQPLRTSAALVLPDGRLLIARTLDIGAEGAAVVADIDPGDAETLTVKIRLPARPSGSRLFQAKGRVVARVLTGREVGFRLSLQFDALGVNASRALAGFLARDPVAGLSFVRW